MRERLRILTVLLLSAAVLSSCGGKKPVATEAVTETAIETEASEAVTETETPAASAGAEMADAREITGEIVDAAMHSLVLKDAEGTQYELSEVDDVDTSGLSGSILVGAKVTVILDSSGMVTAIRDPEKS